MATLRLPRMPQLPAALTICRYDPATLYRVSSNVLLIADLTGAALRQLGGHAELSGTSSYRITKAWSTAIHAHPDKVDGLLYMSRHKNDEKALVLFDRCAHKLNMALATPLTTHAGFGDAATLLGIGCAFP